MLSFVVYLHVSFLILFFLLHLFNFSRIKKEFDSLPSYVYDDVDNWSMNDLVNVRNGTFLNIVNSIIQKSEDHVFNCEVSSTNKFIYFK